MAATRWCSHDCGREAAIQRLRRQGGGIVLTAEHSTGGDVGVAGCRPTDAATKSHRKHQGARAEVPARLAGADQAARARSTERSSAAMATLGGEVDESPRSGGNTRRGRADAPYGGGGARRSSPESGEERVGDSESLEGGLGLGHDRAGERVRGGQLGRAGPVKPTRVD
jgi:hypothetical protein